MGGGIIEKQLCASSKHDNYYNNLKMMRIILH